MPKNAEVAALFERTADVLAIQGANSFRVLAYRKIARTLEETPHDIETLAASEALDELPGIGESSADKIREYLRTGHIAEFESIWSDVPPGVMQMMRVPAVGPKTAALLWQEGSITTIEELKAKLDQPDYGNLNKIPTLGNKKLQKIKQNLAFLETAAARVRIGQALPIALALVHDIQQIKGVQDAQYCGSLRRGKETVGDIDIAVAADPQFGQPISDALTAHPLVADVLGSGPTKTSFRTTAGLQIDVRVVPPASYGAAVLYFTGSKEHNVRLRERAIKRGLKLNEWGLFKTTQDAQEETQIAGASETDVYNALDLAYIPPEMREDNGEIDAAEKAHGAKKQTALELVEPHHIRGDLHMHTTASDGTRSIEDMVAECKRRGYLYCAITDHSKSQFQANGLRSDRLLEHIKAIHAVAREAKGILVLAGAEVDILADGSLDYEDDILAQLDWVVASPHAALSQETDPATQRLVRAAANPYVHVLGHPTGRIVGSRRGLEPDMQKVIFAAARNGIALEINANHHRLDLRDSHARLARDANVPICINTDAHAYEDFNEMPYGILTARRAWLSPTQVLNTLPLPAFKKWLKAKKDKDTDWA